MSIESIRAILKDIDTSLASKTDELLDRWIGYSMLDVKVDYFGTEDNIDYQRCVAYLTASKLQSAVLGSQASSSFSNGTGGIKSTKALDLAVEYYQTSSSGNSSASTTNLNTKDIYYQEYRTILFKYTKTGLMMTISSVC